MMHDSWPRSAVPASGAPCRRLRASLVGLLTLACLCQSALAGPVYSKSRRFRIPFQFDAAELQRLGAAEVRLFVSFDQGQRWNLAEGVPPESARFTFEAPGDGEYWFSVKTLTTTGHDYPAGPHEPGLKVIVDQLPPVLDLELQEVEPGRVRLTWRAQDDRLHVPSLQLEFQEPGSSDWKPVEIRAAEQGQTTWTVASSGTLKVRGSVEDLAGHKGEASREIELSANPEAQQRQFLNSGRPVAIAPETRENIKANGPLTTSPPSAPIAAAPAPIPAVSPAPIPAQLVSTPAGQTPAIVPTATPQAPPSQNPDAVQPLAEPPALAPPALAQPGNAPRPGHLVNSRSFRLGYDVEDVGPSGVGRVDLYITEDGGNKWYHYGADPDRQSPVEVSVPADGEFGFSFRIANGLGFLAPPPQPGEPPEVVITVDRTPPVARLLPLQQGHGPQRDQVLIQWTAQDRQLHERPILLSYAAQPTGPWEQIQDWQPNSGSFLWTLPASLDQQVYLRLDVRDAAGNLTRVDAERPFLVDRSRPRARVTDVEPVRPAQR